jgi:hypothetical protein
LGEHQLDKLARESRARPSLPEARHFSHLRGVVGRLDSRGFLLATGQTLAKAQRRLVRSADVRCEVLLRGTLDSPTMRLWSEVSRR